MRPLADVRIVAVEQYGAGPWGSMLLADLGADVIKIEDPNSGGDVGRSIPPFCDDADSLFFQAFNRNKRSIALDLTTAAGRTVFENLVRRSDAVYSNLRGDVPAKLRLRYDDLKQLNRRIVCCALSAFGTDGPRRSEPGYDYVIQGLSGWMHLTGSPDGPPQRSGLSLVDFSGGFVAAIALLVGVHAARRDDVGMDCDVSLLDTALSLLNYNASWYLTRGFEPSRTSSSAHPSLVPFQMFSTADEPIVVACAKETFWRRLTIVIEQPELADDPEYATFADRLRNRDRLIPLLEERFAQRGADEWLDRLRAEGVPAGPVNDLAATFRDEQVVARGLVVETDHPQFGRVRQVANPVRLSNDHTSYARAPRLDEHASDVLVDLLGYEASDIGALRDAGAFGDKR